MLAGCLLVLVLTYRSCKCCSPTHSLLVVVLVQSALAGSAALFLGCMPAVLVELFPRPHPGYRPQLSVQFSLAVFGGFAPLIAASLISATGLPVSAGFWVISAALFSTIAVLVLRETRAAEI